ncbi:MAG: hypothetical protein MR239_02855 [Clostridiales bacterium]|nr:hypothetical protein [Clostridiales bacterium]MDY4655514.1 hypothetical protein [Eubacteriales bacterium]
MKKKPVNDFVNKKTDPDGSYTGTRIPSGEYDETENLTPVQDADDL